MLNHLSYYPSTYVTLSNPVGVLALLAPHPVTPDRSGPERTTSMTSNFFQQLRVVIGAPLRLMLKTWLFGMLFALNEI